MVEVIIGYGCQMRDLQQHKDVVDHLNARMTSTTPDTWLSRPGQPAVNVRLVYTRQGFASALDTNGAIVIYDGHSRHGQGPSFGPPNTPECPPKSFGPNPWGDHFRMGYDVVDVPCVGEILKHGTAPTEFAPPSKAKRPFASAGVLEAIDGAVSAGSVTCRSRGAWRALSTCHPKVAAKVNCRGERSLAGRHYWRGDPAVPEFNTLVSVGDADLAASKLRCRVLFMNSCASRRHFLEPLQRHKQRVKSNCAFFVTGDTCSAATTLTFLKVILKGKDVTANRGQDVLPLLNGQQGSGLVSLVT